MAWYRTKTAVTIGAVLLIAGAGLAVKRTFWPVTDSIFQLDYKKLQNAPGGIVLLRPTHFSDSAKTGMFATGFKPDQRGRPLRMIGRNVSLSEVIQAAYGCDPSRIVLPPDAPTEKFDFLVTVSKNPQERLQAAIMNKLGYVARRETRDATVLHLVVKTPDAPGLRCSTEETGRTDYSGGKLHYKHQPVEALTGYLGEMLKQPVRDKTGLTGFYDYSVEWNLHIRTGTPDQDDFAKSLRDMGLALVPGKEKLEMLVVERAKN